MDILQKINELEKEVKESEAKEQEFHDRAILLRRKIGKLKTALRDASEILGEEVPLGVIDNALPYTQDADNNKQD
jgi:uncharacterized protein YnzC (UPF0291/DUF896 family)